MMVRNQHLPPYDAVKRDGKLWVVQGRHSRRCGLRLRQRAGESLEPMIDVVDCEFVLVVGNDGVAANRRRVLRRRRNCRLARAMGATAKEGARSAMPLALTDAQLKQVIVAAGCLISTNLINLSPGVLSRMRLFCGIDTTRFQNRHANASIYRFHLFIIVAIKRLNPRV